MADSAAATAAAAVGELAQGLGFALLGIAPAEPSRHGDDLRRWLAEGRQGDMDFMLTDLDARLDPARLLPGARSVICVADRYPSEPTPPVPLPPRPARIARYAWGDDYHRVIKKRLHRLADALRLRYPQHQYRSAVDTAPVMEREHALRAGLGWIGKHTLLLHPQLGSWLLLGQIITTLELVDPASPPTAVPDHCGTCTRCLDACPTACLTPWRIDARRCISYLTIEHRGLVDPSLHEAMGDWVAGCDVCQEVCPYNRPQHQERGEQPPTQARYATRPPGPALDLLDLLQWTPQQRQAALVNSALKRIRLEQFKRNALIAAGNLLRRRDEPALRTRIKQLAAEPSESELVRQTAAQVLTALTSATSGSPRS